MINIDLNDYTIISNGKTIWNNIKKDKSVQINNYTEDATEFAPQKLFFAFEKNFEPEEFTKYQSSNGESSWVLTCKTKSKTWKNIKQIKLWLDFKTKEIKSLQIISDRNTQTWSINKLSLNKTISDNLFEYKIPKDFKKNDLR